MIQTQAVTIASKIFSMSPSQQNYILSGIEILTSKVDKAVLFDDIDSDEDMSAIAEAESELRRGKFITRTKLQNTISNYL